MRRGILAPAADQKGCYGRTSSNFLTGAVPVSGPRGRPWQRPSGCFLSLFPEAMAEPAISCLEEEESLDPCPFISLPSGGDDDGLCLFSGYYEYFNENVRKMFIWPLDGAQAMGNPVWFREVLKGRPSSPTDCFGTK